MHPFGLPLTLILTWQLPGAVRARMGVGALAEVLDLGPHVRQVDRRGDERDDREEADGAAVGGRVEAEHESDTEDKQPLQLGQLPGGEVRLRGPDHGIDECPGLDVARRDRERKEEVVERAVCPAYYVDHVTKLPRRRNYAGPAVSGGSVSSPGGASSGAGRSRTTATTSAVGGFWLSRRNDS